MFYCKHECEKTKKFVCCYSCPITEDCSMRCGNYKNYEMSKRCQALDYEITEKEEIDRNGNEH